MAGKEIKWMVAPRKAGPGYFGRIVLPAGKAPIAVTAPGATQQDALATAAGLAEQIADNPIINAVLPPGTSAAIKATKMLAKAAGAGKLAEGMEHLVGEGAKRVGKVLKKLKFW